MDNNVDLIVERPNGTKVGYVVRTPSVSLSSSTYTTRQSSVEHQKYAPNVPMNVGIATPTQAGGQYDVRDSDGDKAIAHLDWSGGAGQESLDNEYSHASRYLTSSNIEVSVPGQMSLAKKMDFVAVQNATGPVYAALGKYWIATEGGGVKYSQDGETWTSAVLNSGTTGPIHDFTTDGSHVYFVVGSGTYPGVWKSTNATPMAFDKISSAQAVGITYANGMLFVATATGAGHLNPSGYAYVEDTFDFLASNLTLGIETVNGVTYWVCSQGGTTFIYSLTYNPTTDTVTPAEVTHLRSGFVGTTAKGYLDSLYIGGYLECGSDETMGQGVVYMLNGGVIQPLCTVGLDPLLHPELDAQELDHRIWAIHPGWDRLYLQCTRGIYAWDLDDGGYQHVSDFYSPALGDPIGGSATDAFEGAAFQQSAFQTSATLYESVAWPGLAFKDGKLLAPYEVESSETTFTFTTNTGAGTTFTASGHGLSNGQYIAISASTTTPTCNGGWYASDVTSSTFKVKSPYDGAYFSASSSGGGTVVYTPDRGVGIVSDGFATVGELTTSVSNFHTGTLRKDFYAISVAHDPLGPGEAIEMSYRIDGGAWTRAAASTTSTTSTKFEINEQGYSIAVRCVLMALGTTTPYVRGINVIWNFIPVRRHVYELDCRKGAAAGRWTEDPETAIRHLYDAANEHASYTDRFTGPYYGIVEKLDYEQASWSPEEGVSGLIEITVRELD